MKQKTLKYFDWSEVSDFIVSETGIDKFDLWKFWVYYITNDTNSRTYIRFDIDTKCNLTFESIELQNTVDKIVPALKKIKNIAGSSSIVIYYDL